MIRYNIQWPAGTNEATVELGAYRLARDGVNTGFPAYEHMYRAACALFTERQYARHYWVRRRMKCFCETPWQTWIGPGSIAKSTDAAMCILLHWLAAPSRTTCIVCSTTVAMLEKRIFGELIRYYRLIPDAPGSYRKSDSAIVLGDENSKNGIFGIAILKGSTREALGNIVGLHNEYVGLVIDEMQATREAAVEAATNLSASGREFCFLGMGNPESRLDPLGRYSEPVAGWDAIHPDSCGDGWDTRYGRCEFFDGYKSPAIVEEGGKEKYFFLLNEDAIEDTRLKYGENSPQFWSQRRGFFPPEGLDRTLFSESLLVKGQCFEPLFTWQTSSTPAAGLDPSFSSMGDRCVLQFGEIGKLTHAGSYGLNLTETVSISLEISKETPLSYHIAARVREECDKRGVTPSCFAMDCTGSQTALADVIESEWGRGIMRVEFGGSASDNPVSVDEEVTGKQRYRNRVTELWYIFHNMVLAAMVRGLSRDTAKELVARRLTEKLKPVQLETKTAMKSRTGYSPDIADAHVVLTALVKERFGVMPGAGAHPSHTATGARDYERIVRANDVDGGDCYEHAWTEEFDNVMNVM